ncbi:hypothetical protein OKT24_02975 [Aeromonas veronii]|uniref:hypothetical protein n=1 Tax=Aeromonas TaxID=642 RepID=UPI00128ED08B|nr:MULTISPECIES: hypothetical protein [Aeromonas]MEB8284734.1 hypothetical protein [Aeromonas veronii]
MSWIKETVQPPKKMLNLCCKKQDSLPVQYPGPFAKRDIFHPAVGRAKPEGDHNAVVIHPVTYSFETNLMMMELIAATRPKGDI